MSQLVGKFFLNSEFKQDKRPDWIKISGVCLGQSNEFVYKNVESSNIGGLLDESLKDPSVSCIQYDWVNKKAYIKSGFNLNFPKDSVVNTGITTFIAKGSIKTSSIITNTVTTVNPNILIAPYCMPGTDTMRAAMNAIKNAGGKPFNITLAFWNGYWDCGDPDDGFMKEFRAWGGDFGVSYGGAAGCASNSEPAIKGGSVEQVANNYMIPIKKYSLKHADFDIEGGRENDMQVNSLRHSAIKIIQNNMPNLKVSFTIAADVEGIYCLNMLSDAVNKGVKIDTIRLMLMDFGKSLNLVSACISGLQNTKKQLDSIGLTNVKLGFIPLLMLDDQKINTYTYNNHVSILSKIKENNMDYVKCFSYWELAIDKSQNFSFLKEYIKLQNVVTLVAPVVVPVVPVVVPVVPVVPVVVPVNILDGLTASQINIIKKLITEFKN